MFSACETRSRWRPTGGSPIPIVPSLTLIFVSQASFDPNNIAALLQQYPYHIDSLMAMFDLYRVRECHSSASISHKCPPSIWLRVHCPCRYEVALTAALLNSLELCQHPCGQATGEHQYADEMLERALYAFECAWHPAFSPATGNCRLEFAHQPNRAFFMCLFRQTQVSALLCHAHPVLPSTEQ